MTQQKFILTTWNIIKKQFNNWVEINFQPMNAKTSLTTSMKIYYFHHKNAFNIFSIKWKMLHIRTYAIFIVPTSFKRSKFDVTTNKNCVAYFKKSNHKWSYFTPKFKKNYFFPNHFLDVEFKEKSENLWSAFRSMCSLSCSWDLRSIIEKFDLFLNQIWNLNEYVIQFEIYLKRKGLTTPSA